MAPLRRFLAIQPEERRLFFRALWLIALVRIGLIFASAPVIGRRLEARVKRAPRRIPLKLAARRIEQAARICPLPVTCLVQTLVSKTLLAGCGYPAVVRIGVLKSGGELHAHAWLECADGVLIGNPSPEGKEFVPLIGAEGLGA